MTTGLRVALLFAVYSGIGYGGDYAFDLFAQDHTELGFDAVETVRVEPVVDVQVDVRPAIRIVQVRRSGECAYTLGHELTLPTTRVDLLSIDAGSGELVVEGRADLDQIVVTAEACASVEAWLDDLQVQLREDGDVASLVTHYPDRSNWGGGDNTAKIDLTVLVPLGFDIAIDDSSGEMRVSGTGDLAIDDSSGEIEVSDVMGSLRIDDSSGGLTIRDVEGDVQIEDGSGGIEIFGVQGSVALRDGSGGIDISEVDQDVLIEDDGSGGIDVVDVGGDFVVAQDGSGGITYSRVGGRVDIPDDQRRRRRRRGGR